jgi:hypothetical protein
MHVVGGTAFAHNYNEIDAGRHDFSHRFPGHRCRAWAVTAHSTTVVANETWTDKCCTAAEQPTVHVAATTTRHYQAVRGQSTRSRTCAGSLPVPQSHDPQGGMRKLASITAECVLVLHTWQHCACVSRATAIPFLHPGQVDRLHSRTCDQKHTGQLAHPNVTV